MTQNIDVNINSNIYDSFNNKIFFEYQQMMIDDFRRIRYIVEEKTESKAKKNLLCKIDKLLNSYYYCDENDYYSRIQVNNNYAISLFNLSI